MHIYLEYPTEARAYAQWVKRVNAAFDSGHRVIIDPMRPALTREQWRDTLDELDALAKAASETEWQLGHSGTETIAEAVRWMEDTIRKRDSPDIWLVFIGQADAEGGTLTTAYTGNGPTSEANARYITAAQPSYVRTLIYVLRKLMGDKTAIVVPWDREEEAPHVHHQ